MTAERTNQETASRAFIISRAFEARRQLVW
jgi:hypothetical protein